MTAEDELREVERTLASYRESLKDVNRLGGDGMAVVRAEWVLRIKELEQQREHLAHVVRKSRARAG
jgi:hypothetical protein